jgi:hypothetical protein
MVPWGLTQAISQFPDDVAGLVVSCLNTQGQNAFSCASRSCHRVAAQHLKNDVASLLRKIFANIAKSQSNTKYMNDLENVARRWMQLPIGRHLPKKSIVSRIGIWIQERVFGKRCPYIPLNSLDAVRLQAEIFLEAVASRLKSVNLNQQGHLQVSKDLSDSEKTLLNFWNSLLTSKDELSAGGWLGLCSLDNSIPIASMQDELLTEDAREDLAFSQPLCSQDISSKKITRCILALGVTKVIDLVLAIQDEQRKAGCLLAIVRFLLTQKDCARAFFIALKIPHSTSSLASFRNGAFTLIASGYLLKKKTGEALRVASNISGEVFTSTVLRKIAISQLARGLVDDAITTAKKIPKKELQFDILEMIVKGLYASGSEERAHSVAENIDVEQRRALLLQLLSNTPVNDPEMVVYSLLIQGNPKEALKNTTAIANSDQRTRLQKMLFEAFLSSGDIEGATTAAKALSLDQVSLLASFLTEQGEASKAVTILKENDHGHAYDGSLVPSLAMQRKTVEAINEITEKDTTMLLPEVMNISMSIGKQKDAVKALENMSAAQLEIAVPAIAAALVEQKKPQEAKELMEKKLPKFTRFPRRFVFSLLTHKEYDLAFHFAKKIQKDTTTDSVFSGNVLPLREIADFHMAKGNVKRAHEAILAMSQSETQKQAFRRFYIKV